MINNIEYLVFQYADDTTVLLNASKNSLRNTLNSFMLISLAFTLILIKQRQFGLIHLQTDNIVFAKT